MNDINKLGIDWLNKNFGNLTEVEKNNITFFIDENHVPLIFYWSNDYDKDVYINHDRIWSFFELVFRYNYHQIQELLKTWLEETYNLKGKTPRRKDGNVHAPLAKPFKLKKK